MKDNRGFRTMSIIALLVAIAGISVAFAALSQNLTINATGIIKGSKWDVQWTAASGSIASGSHADTSFGAVSGVNSAGLTITGIQLVTPGDSVTWTLTASNLGDFDAELSSIATLLTKNITIDPDDTGVITAADVIVTLTKADDSAVAVGDTLTKSTVTPTNAQQYKLTVTFNPLATKVPSKNVEIEISSSFPWVQK